MYVGTYKSFDAYCQARWDFKRAHAYRLMDAANAVENLSPIGDIPHREAIIRPLTRLPKDEQKEAWSEAVKAAGRVLAARSRGTIDEAALTRDRAGWYDPNCDRGRVDGENALA